MLTLANYVAGTGPRLQMLSGDGDLDRMIEREFRRWAKAIGLAHKLRTVRVTEAESGKAFAILATTRGSVGPQGTSVWEGFTSPSYSPTPWRSSGLRSRCQW